MASLFYEMKSLTSLNVGRLDTSLVTDMSNMFCGMLKIQSLGLDNFNTGNVLKMYSMLSGMSSASKLELLSFNTYKVKKMEKLFSYYFNDDQNEMNGLNLLTLLDISSFEINDETNVDNIFEGIENRKEFTFVYNEKLKIKKLIVEIKKKKLEKNFG